MAWTEEQYNSRYGRQQQPYINSRASRGGFDPRIMEELMAMIFAQRDDEQQGTVAQLTEEIPNPYIASPLRPTPRGLSPIDRFNDMGLRQQGRYAAAVQAAQAAKAQSELDQFPEMARRAAQPVNLVDEGLVNFGNYGSGFSATGSGGAGAGFDGTGGDFEDWRLNRISDQHRDKWAAADKAKERQTAVHALTGRLGLRRR